MDRGEKQLLAELGRQPGWAVLARLLKEKREQDIRSYGSKVLFGKEGVPAVEASRVRGFHQGAAWLIQQADKAFSEVYIEEDLPSD